MRKTVSLPRGEIVVVSPHLDDAALSLGAALSRAARESADVTVLTVLAGDTKSEVAAGPWDASCGFSTAGEAARERRKEDARACAILAAKTFWLPFGDAQYERGGTDDEVWSVVEGQLSGADLVLAPGYPLAHPDHVWLTQLLLRRLPRHTPIGLFVEQPYATDKAIGRGYSTGPLLAATHVALRTQEGRSRLAPQLPRLISDFVGSPVSWAPLRADRRDRRTRDEAIRAYESQLPGFGRRLLPRLRLYERAYGGEGMGRWDRKVAEEHPAC